MLEKLLTSSARVKILQYLILSKRSTHLREIARECKIPVSAAKREIDNLESIGLIAKNNNTIELNNNSNILQELKSIIVKTDGAFFPIKKALENLDIDYALIFGSFAKGDFSTQSDIDLFVIGNASQKEIFGAIGPVERVIQKEINPIVWKKEEFILNRKKSFIKDIAKGKILVLRGEEHELRKFIGAG